MNQLKGVVACPRDNKLKLGHFATSCVGLKSVSKRIFLGPESFATPCATSFMLFKLESVDLV